MMRKKSSNRLSLFECDWPIECFINSAIIYVISTRNLSFVDFKEDFKYFLIYGHSLEFYRVEIEINLKLVNWFLRS